ncbi:MAG: hypothetical protein JKY86_09405 [Gammaproteobacteria bacterium]|nr:hypothetical protein [Gammaproteobacteria bacterium]
MDGDRRTLIRGEGMIWERFLQRVVGAAIAQTDVSATWVLNGPGTESEILLTED